jgi:hypothetical protein
MATVIKVRSDILFSIATKNPKFMMQLHTSLPLPPADPQTGGGPSTVLRSLLSEMEFTEEQRIGIREAWGKFCHSRDLIRAQVAEISSLLAIRQPVAGTSTGAIEEIDIGAEVNYNLKPESVRADTLSSALKVAKDLEFCQVRMIMATCQLANETVTCCTWQQFAITNLRIRPYVNDICQWCEYFSELYL